MGFFRHPICYPNCQSKMRYFCFPQARKQTHINVIMPHCCCIKNCLSGTIYERNETSFHRIPATKIKEERWIDAICKATSQKPTDFSKTSRVCSNHFNESDYNTGTTRLKSNSYPSVFGHTKV